MQDKLIPSFYAAILPVIGAFVFLYYWVVVYSRFHGIREDERKRARIMHGGDSSGHVNGEANAIAGAAAVQQQQDQAAAAAIMAAVAARAAAAQQQRQAAGFAMRQMSD